jgi:regulator of replication initiation timing
MKLWADRKIDANQFAFEVASYANFIEDMKNWRSWEDLGKLKVRGPDRIRSVLLDQKRLGNLSAEEVAFAEWFILRNENLLGDLGIAVQKPSEKNGSSGFYNVLTRVMYLIKGHTNDDTVVHEIMHHLERMLPQDIRMAIKRAWAKELDRFERLPYDGKNENDIMFFQAIRAFHNQEKVNLNGEDLSPSKAFSFATGLISSGKVDGRLYQYVNPSEFWAVNATDILKGRYDVQGSLLGRLRNWLRELSTKIKGLFGIDSNAPIIKALDSLAKGDGKFVSNLMLEEKPGDLRDITPLDEKRAEKKISELESILNNLDKAMKDEAFGIPQMQRKIVSALDNALNNLDDIADNAPAEFNDRIDDLEIKIADLKAIAGASLKPANENKLETEVQKAERELRVASQALDKAFDDDRAYKDRRTKDRKAYEKEYDQLEKVYNEAFAKWDKLYREESAAIMMALTNGTPDQMRNAVAKAQKPYDKSNEEAADIQSKNRGCD